jgi:hypothetical protein
LQEAHFARFFNGAATALFRRRRDRTSHEIIEKALPDERVEFLHADQIAVRAERDGVKAAAFGGSSSSVHETL